MSLNPAEWPFTMDALRRAERMLHAAGVPEDRHEDIMRWCSQRGLAPDEFISMTYTAYGYAGMVESLLEPVTYESLAAAYNRRMKTLDRLGGLPGEIHPL